VPRRFMAAASRQSGPLTTGRTPNHHPRLFGDGPCWSPTSAHDVGPCGRAGRGRRSSGSRRRGLAFALPTSLRTDCSRAVKLARSTSTASSSVVTASALISRRVIDGASSASPLAMMRIASTS
jgi:hypothetical protein